MMKPKNVQVTATKKALPTPAPASTPAPTPSVGKAKPKKAAKAKPKKAAKAKPKKAAKAKPVVPMVIPKKGKNCRGKWSKWSACSDDCKKTKTWTTTTEPTGDGKACPSPNTKSKDCTAKHSYRCAPGYVPRDMKRGKPGEAQAQALAERKAKWDADAPKRAASQARIDALVADFDPNDPAYGPADTGLTVTGGGRYGTARDEHLY